MYVFGGMCGARLDDLWQLDLGNLNLTQGFLMISKGTVSMYLIFLFDYLSSCTKILVSIYSLRNR